MIAFSPMYFINFRVSFGTHQEHKATSHGITCDSTFYSNYLAGVLEALPLVRSGVLEALLGCSGVVEALLLGRSGVLEALLLGRSGVVEALPLGRWGALEALPLGRWGVFAMTSSSSLQEFKALLTTKKKVFISGYTSKCKTSLRNIQLCL